MAVQNRAGGIDFERTVFAWEEVTLQSVVGSCLDYRWIAVGDLEHVNMILASVVSAGGRTSHQAGSRDKLTVDVVTWTGLCLALDIGR